MARLDGMPLPSDQFKVGKYLQDWLDSARPVLRHSVLPTMHAAIESSPGRIAWQVKSRRTAAVWRNAYGVAKPTRLTKICQFMGPTMPCYTSSVKLKIIGRERVIVQFSARVSVWIPDSSATHLSVLGAAETTLQRWKRRRASAPYLKQCFPKLMRPSSRR